MTSNWQKHFFVFFISIQSRLFPVKCRVWLCQLALSYFNKSYHDIHRQSVFNLMLWASGTPQKSCQKDAPGVESFTDYSTKIQMYHCIHWFGWNGIIFYGVNTLVFPPTPSSCSAKTFTDLQCFLKMTLLDGKVVSDVNMAGGRTEHKIQDQLWPVWLQGIQCQGGLQSWDAVRQLLLACLLLQLMLAVLLAY